MVYLEARKGLNDNMANSHCGTLTRPPMIFMGIQVTDPKVPPPMELSMVALHYTIYDYDPYGNSVFDGYRF